MKILLVIDRLTNPHAGTEGQFLLLINLLQTAGCELRVVVLANSEWLETNPLPCLTDVIGSSSIKSPRTWWKVYHQARQAKKDGYHLAHIFFNDASVVCPPMFALAGIKSIISRRDMGFWYNSIYRAVLPFTGKFVSCALSNSRAVANITGKVERIPDSKLRVIYNGFNPRLSAEVKIPELEILKSSGATLFGLVANIRPIKRMQDAICALAQLDLIRYNPHLVIIGAGDATELKALAGELNVGERVHFLGSRSDIPNCLQYLSTGLLCSESEGFSNAIVEYQFAGLPVICSRTGGNPEAVTQDLTGWLYDVGNIEELSKAMASVLSAPAHAKTMGIAAKKEAESRYTIDAMLNEHLSLYRELIGVKP
jgi:glycosyltransferase involved in cell wall biosynthesis